MHVYLPVDYAGCEYQFIALKPCIVALQLSSRINLGCCGVTSKPELVLHLHLLADSSSAQHFGNSAVDLIEAKAHLVIS